MRWLRSLEAGSDMVCADVRLLSSLNRFLDRYTLWLLKKFFFRAPERNTI